MSPPAPPGTWRRRGPLAVALAILFVAVGVLVAWSSRHSAGHLVYALDDAYIHMAMARNLAGHGVFGVTRYGFTSSSSSPLWTLLLAGLFALLGPRDWLPLALNVLFAASLLAVADRVLQAHGVRPPSRLLALVAVVVFTPLPPLVLVGQEHVLHATLTLAFAGLLTLAPPRAALLLIAPALTAMRYEGLFLVFIACLVLAARRRFAFALALGVVSLLPPALYGLVSLAHGWYALPNPVILKGALGEGLTGWRRIALVPFLGGWGELARTPHVLALVALAAVTLLARWRSPSSREGTLLIVFIGTAILHLQYARTGWFYRYEAYLVALGIVAAAVALDGLGDRVRPRWLPVALASAVALVCAVRGVRVAVIYERWLDPAGGIPTEWVRAGRWRVASNVVLGDRTVAFYAVDPAEAEPLADHLRAFAPELPPGVAQLGFYTR